MLVATMGDLVAAIDDTPYRHNGMRPVHWDHLQRHASIQAGIGQELDQVLVWSPATEERIQLLAECRRGICVQRSHTKHDSATPNVGRKRIGVLVLTQS